MRNSKKELLRRYTRLSSLLDFLESGKLTFSLFEEWPDKNDVEYLKIYNQVAPTRKITGVLCLCATDEKIEFWDRYANGDDGVCIEFDKDALLSELNIDSVSHRVVQYRNTVQISKVATGYKKLPFLKRSTFRGEEEYRFLLHDRADRNLDVSTAAINRIHLSPYMTEAQAERVRKYIQFAKFEKNKRVNHSTANENAKWSTHGYRIAGLPKPPSRKKQKD